jgi:adenylyltransferase/sulfurtransferase
MLRDCVGGKSSVTIDAETLAGALETIRAQFPLLRVHIWNDDGTVRQHLLIFHNDTMTRWMPTLDVPLKEGDQIQFVQAVSGG